MHLRTELDFPLILFLTVWLVLFIFLLFIWFGEADLLAQWGVLDFAGGIVVHASAGMAALASVFYVGKRKIIERGPHRFHWLHLEQDYCGLDGMVLMQEVN